MTEKTDTTTDNTTELKRLSAKQSVENKIAELLAPLGFEAIAVDFVLSGPKKLRVFIDKISTSASTSATVSSIGIGDCVLANKALDEPLDQSPEIETVFGGRYELEVSSPGVDRPLRRVTDFKRFSGKLARIHLVRPLSPEEGENAEYVKKNPKQKNFIGTLLAVKESSQETQNEIKNEIKVVLSLDENNPSSQVTIPLGLISKANLEPVFDFADEKKGKRK